MTTKNTNTSRPYLRDHVYEAVRDLLVNTAATLDAPVRVPEGSIASQLGVSRTPVREALARLGHEGIVSFQPRRGAMLLPVSPREYLEWLDIRTELEAMAARHAAMNTTQNDVLRLRAIFAPFTPDTLAEQASDYAKANVAFHEALIDLTGNTLLMRIWSSFGHRQMAPSGTIARLNRAHDSLAEHHALIDAIEARDPQRADALAREHVLSLRRQVTQALPDFQPPGSPT